MTDMTFEQAIEKVGEWSEIANTYLSYTDIIGISIFEILDVFNTLKAEYGRQIKARENIEKEIMRLRVCMQDHNELVTKDIDQKIIALQWVLDSGFFPRCEPKSDNSLYDLLEILVNKIPSGVEYDVASKLLKNLKAENKC